MPRPHHPLAPARLPNRYVPRSMWRLRLLAQQRGPSDFPIIDPLRSRQRATEATRRERRAASVGPRVSLAHPFGPRSPPATLPSAVQTRLNTAHEDPASGVPSSTPRHGPKQPTHGYLRITTFPVSAHGIHVPAISAHIRYRYTPFARNWPVLSSVCHTSSGPADSQEKTALPDKS